MPYFFKRVRGQMERRLTTDQETAGSIPAVLVFSKKKNVFGQFCLAKLPRSLDHFLLFPVLGFGNCGFSSFFGSTKLLSHCSVSLPVVVALALPAQLRIKEEMCCFVCWCSCFVEAWDTSTDYTPPPRLNDSWTQWIRKAQHLPSLPLNKCCTWLTGVPANVALQVCGDFTQHLPLPALKVPGVTTRICNIQPQLTSLRMW